MITMIKKTYDAYPASSKSIWTTERTDWPNWEQVKHLYMGRRTLMMAGALLVEGLSFAVLQDSPILDASKARAVNLVLANILPTQEAINAFDDMEAITEDYDNELAKYQFKSGFAESMLLNELVDMVCEIAIDSSSVAVEHSVQNELNAYAKGMLNALELGGQFSGGTSIERKYTASNGTVYAFEFMYSDEGNFTVRAFETDPETQQILHHNSVRLNLPEVQHDELEISVEKIGKKEKGIDGSDEYVMLTSASGQLTLAQAERWLLRKCFREAQTPGGYYCTSVKCVDVGEDGRIMGIIYHRYDN